MTLAILLMLCVVWLARLFALLARTLDENDTRSSLGHHEHVDGQQSYSHDAQYAKDPAPACTFEQVASNDGTKYCAKLGTRRERGAKWSQSVAN